MGTGKKLCRAEAEMRGLKLEVVAALRQSEEREGRRAAECAYWRGRYWVAVVLAYLVLICWAATATAFGWGK